MDEFELMQDNYAEVTLSEEQQLALAKINEECSPVISAIARLEEQAKAIEAEGKKMKAQILEAMEKYHVKSINNDLMTISYVPPTTRTTLDSKALKEEMPEVFKEYSKTSKVKSSVRVKLK